MPDFIDQLQKSLGDAFRIEQELGGGGMSRVFLVTETALNRRIVLKVMSPELAAGLSAERFQREVMLAASLQQANIVPLLTTGGANGLPWYTMPFVRGKSLRERLQSNEPLPLPEAVSVLKDIARALAYAHAEGIVHRDIKPENVLLSGGTAVVSDFGIAKAMDIARTAGSASLTHTGASMGTPAYMAPEQVAGDPVDQRTDLYAWGLVAYEVLAGAHPFAGRANVQSVMAAQIAEAPPSLHSVRPEISPALAALVDQCLAKDAAARPRNAGEILRVLDELSLSSSTGDPQRPSPSRMRRAVRPLAMAAVAGVVVVGLALSLTRFRGTSNGAGTAAGADSVRSIAVLPFLNVGGDSTQEYLADGMTDELATALGRMRGLRVTARSSAYRYKNRRDVDVRSVGQELGTRYLLLGTVRRLGNQLRVSAQLANTSDGTELWSRNFDRPAADVLQVQDSLTNAIATALERQFSAEGAPLPGAPAVARAQGTTNAAAYDLYLQGNYLLAQRRPGLEGAASAFERAIAIDSGFARAYAGLANVLALYFYFGSAPMRPRLDSVTFVAGRALTLDSTLAEAHVALGIANMSQARWSSADEHLRNATTLEPGYATAHFQLGRLHMYLGQVEKGREELELAKRLDPYTPLFSAWLAFALAAEGDTARALSEARRSLELDSLSLLVTNFWPMTHLLLGRADEARMFVRRVVRVPFNEGTIAYILGATGARDEARAIVQEIRARRAGRWQDERNLSYALLGLGDTAQAFEAIERSRARAEPIASFFPLWSPVFDSVRGSARFAKFAESVGLDGAAIRR